MLGRSVYLNFISLFVPVALLELQRRYRRKMDSVQEIAHQTLVGGTIKPDFGYTHEYTISLYCNIRTGPRWVIVSHESAFSSVLSRTVKIR